MRVPFANMKAQHRENREALDLAISRFTEQGDLILGDNVEWFEGEFRTYFGAKYAFAVNTPMHIGGTSAVCGEPGRRSFRARHPRSWLRGSIDQWQRSESAGGSEKRRWN